jgi:chemotaxis protein CheD
MIGRRQRVDIFLAPGELRACRRPAKIKTVVGSCIAVCLWDPHARVGGVNHFLLPRPAPAEPGDTRHGTVAMRALFDRIQALGADPARLEATIVGGGHPLAARDNLHIGRQNIAVADDYLAERGVRVLRREVAGPRGRKLLFDTGTGRLLVRLLGAGGRATRGTP